MCVYDTGYLKVNSSDVPIKYRIWKYMGCKWARKSKKTISKGDLRQDMYLELLKINHQTTSIIKYFFVLFNTFGDI